MILRLLLEEKIIFVAGIVMAMLVLPFVGIYIAYLCVKRLFGIKL